MADITIAAAFGGGFGTCLLGLWLRRRLHSRWEFINPRVVHPWSEGRTIRGNGHGGPTTRRMAVDEWVRKTSTNPPPLGAKPGPPAGPPEKPEPPLGRVVDASGRTIGTIRMGTPVYIDAHGQCRIHPSFRPPGAAPPSPPPSEP